MNNREAAGQGEYRTCAAETHILWPGTVQRPTSMVLQMYNL